MLSGTKKLKTHEGARIRGKADDDEAYGVGQRMQEANQRVDTAKEILGKKGQAVRSAVQETEADSQVEQAVRNLH